MSDERTGLKERPIPGISIERARVRLAQVEESLRVQTVLRDHCQDWADEHHRAVLHLEDERIALRKMIGI